MAESFKEQFFKEVRDYKRDFIKKNPALSAAVDGQIKTIFQKYQTFKKNYIIPFNEKFIFAKDINEMHKEAIKPLKSEKELNIEYNQLNAEYKQGKTEARIRHEQSMKNALDHQIRMNDLSQSIRLKKISQLEDNFFNITLRFQDGQIKLPNELDKQGLRAYLIKIRSDALKRYNSNKLNIDLLKIKVDTISEEEFHKIVGLNSKFAEVYQRELKLKIEPVIRFNKANDFVAKTTNPFQEYLQSIHPKANEVFEISPLVKQTVTTGRSSKLFNKLGLPESRVGKVGNAIVEMREYLNNHQDVAKDFTVEKVNVGNGFENIKIKFRVKRKKEWVEYNLPISKGQFFKFDGLSKARLDTFTGERGKYGSTILTTSTEQMIDLVKNKLLGQGIMEAVNGTAAESSQKINRMIKHSLTRNPTTTGQITDYFRAYSYTSAETQMNLGNRPRMVQQGLIASQSLVSLKKMNQFGADRVAYDIETTFDDPNVGSQAMARKQGLKMYSITLTRYNSNNVRIGSKTFWIKPEGYEWNKIRTKQLDDLHLPVEEIKSLTTKSSTAKGLKETQLAIDEWLNQWKTPFVLFGHNESEFDRIITTKHLPNKHGIFYTSLTNGTAVDMEKVLRLVENSKKSFKLERFVQETVFNNDAKKYSDWRTEKVRMLENEDKSLTKLFKSAAAHTSSYDNELLNQELLYLLHEHKPLLGLADSQMGKYSNLQQYSKLGQKIEMLQNAERGKHFFGQDSDKQVSHELFPGTINPGVGAKGISSFIDIAMIFPYGFLSNLSRQHYQRLNGVTMKKPTQLEMEHFKKTQHMNMLNPPLVTEYYKGLYDAATAQDPIYKKQTLRNPNMRVAYLFNKHVLTSDEAAIVHQNINNIYKFKGEDSKSLQLGNAIVPEGADAVFTENLTNFHRLRKQVEKHYKEMYPNKPFEELEDLIVETTRERMRQEGHNYIFKPESPKPFQARIRNVDFGDNPKSIAGAVVSYDFNHPIGLGTAYTFAGGKMTGQTKAKEMYVLRRGKNNEMNKLDVMLAGEGKFFKRGEFGQYYEVLVNKILWHEIHYNEGKNLQQIANRLNAKLVYEGTNPRLELKTVGQNIAESMMKGTPTIETLAEIGRGIGMEFDKATNENFYKALNITKDAQKKMVDQFIKDKTQEIVRQTELFGEFNTEEKLKPFVERQVKAMVGFLEPVMGDKNIFGKGVLALVSEGPVAINDQFKAGNMIRSTSIRIRPIIQKLMLMNGQNSKEDYIDFFERYRGKDNTAIKTLQNIRFISEHFFGLKTADQYEHGKIPELNRSLNKLNQAVIHKTMGGIPINNITIDQVRKHGLDIDNKSLAYISEDGFKELKTEMKTSRYHRYQDLAGTIFDRQEMQRLGVNDIFKVTLPGKGLDVTNMNEIIDSIAPDSAKRTEFRKKWYDFSRSRSIQHTGNIKEILMIAPNEVISNMFSQSSEKNFTKLEIAQMNLMTQLKGFQQGQENRTILESLAKFAFAFETQLHKKKLIGSVNDVVIPGVIGQIGTNLQQVLDMSLDKKIKLDMGHGFVTRRTLEKYRTSGGTSMWENLKEMYKYSNEDLLKNFGPEGNKFIPGFLVAEPEHQNKFRSDLMYKIIDGQKIGLLPHEEQIYMDPITLKMKLRDMDKDKAFMHLLETQTAQQLESAQKKMLTAGNKTYWRSNGTLHPEVKQAIDDINNDKRRYRDGYYRLMVDEKTQTIYPTVVPFTKNTIIDPTTGIEVTADTGEILSLSKRDPKSLYKFLEKQRQQEMMNIVSKTAIPYVTTQLTNTIDALYTLVAGGQNPTLEKLLASTAGKANERAENALLDLTNAWQKVFNLKRGQNKAEDMITSVVDKIRKLENRTNKSVLNSLVEEKIINKDTADFMTKFGIELENVRKTMSEQAFSKLATGFEGGSLYDLINVGQRISKAWVGDAMNIFMDTDYYKAPTIAKEMQKGLWEEFSNTYKKESAAMLKTGKYAGIAALGYLGLNFFRPDQMSNKYNPLDMFVDLGPQEGFGGEQFDYFGKNYGLSRITPLDIPQQEFDNRTHLVLEDPYAQEKREAHTLQVLDDLLNQQDLGMINVGFKKQLTYSYNSKLQTINRHNIQGIMDRGGAVLK